MGKSTGDFTRRRFLQAGGGAAAAALLAACSNTTTPAAAPGTPGATGSLPAATGSSIRSAAQLNDIDHVVIFIKENRSFDHYFGARRGVTGFGDPKLLTGADGRSILYQPDTNHPDGYILPFHFDTATTKAQCSLDPSHSWESQHAAWNNGKMDGFATAMGPASLGYFQRADLPYYWALADQFTLCDHMFCSVLGPTGPNRLYSMTGTIDAGGKGGGPVPGNDSGASYTWETYPERLQKAGISWRVYHQSDDDDGDNVLKNFKAYQGLAAGNPLYDNAVVDRDANAFLADATAGNLPQVSWIIAPTALTEHPIWPPAFGEDLTNQTLDAVMANPKSWAKTVFFLTYDENGGFFDHVAPPSPPPGTKDEFVRDQPIGLGFRVPMTVVSPWSRGGKVNTDVFDHTSVLRFLEARWGVEVPNLSEWRRATCGDLTSTLQLGTADASVPTLPDTAAGVDAAKQACSTLPLPDVPSPQVVPTQNA